ncbi:MAG: hypothetical protein O8C62_09425 [Candidatus Methanoperedens sp.]|nr:hypothetical protein [Candidatus Methanoperedens sp.]
MDKKIYKYAAFIILLLLFSADGYYIYQHGVDLGLEKPALILKVSTNLTDEGTPRVNNVTFEQSSVPFFYKTTDTAPNFPEIDVNARINNVDSIPASFWASVHYTGEDTYTLKVFFKSGSEPKKGDILIMPIRITNYRGAVDYKTTAFYEWE